MREIKASVKARGITRERSVAAAKRRVRDDQFYFIRRHGHFFRHGGHGYCINIADAGVFSANKARLYLDVEGLSVIPVSSMRKTLLERVAELTEAVDTMRVILATPDRLADAA